jgi:hypothetical protein
MSESTRIPLTVASRTYSAICLDPPPGELAEPITLRDKLACMEATPGCPVTN